MTNSIKENIVKKIQNAGVVGAGGAGFPTHLKANSSAEIIIINASECEPLMQKDREILLHYLDKVIEGAEIIKNSTDAKKIIVGIKSKHKDIIEKINAYINSNKKDHISIFEMEDYYPAGDEFVLVYEATGRLIPQGGIPIQVGVVVDNVETLYNVAKSSESPVTEKFLTVTGAVKSPATLKIPIGITFQNLIDLAGGSTTPNPVVIDGGAMMGRVVSDLSTPVIKTTGGIIVLPNDHPLIWRKTQDRKVFSRIGKSCCDQCTYCTQFCPRYLLGYSIQPHKVMRSLGFVGNGKKIWSEWALLCCECSLCSLYACPEQLDPKNICVSAKSDLRNEKISWKTSGLYSEKRISAHPMQPFRKVPIPKLMKRLGLYKYKNDAPLKENIDLKIKEFIFPLKQHLGETAKPVVQVGQKINKGDLIAHVPEGKLGANLHSSINGLIKSIDSDKILGETEHA
ncbi:MAG: SLBB domain-containing protein [Elusimicrobia bacterium]|nr:SLBB domain-containing protein [Candidatus Obscuribacterium magneticum]